MPALLASTRCMLVAVSALLMLDCSDQAGPVTEVPVSPVFFDLKALSIGRIIDFARDPVAGRLILCDDLSRTIWVLSAEGSLLRTIGRPGAGPGEFEDLSSVGVNTSGEIIAFDYRLRRLQIFSSEGVFIGGLSVSGQRVSPAPLSVGNDGVLYLQDREADFTNPYWHVLANGTQKELTPPYDELRAGKESDQRQAQVVQVPGAAKRMAAVGPSGEIAFGDGIEYKVTIVSRELTTKSIGLGFRKRSYTATQKQRVEGRIRAAGAAAGVRSLQPVVTGPKAHYTELAFGSDGRLWVRVVNDRDLMRRPGDDPSFVLWDVFEQDGRFVSRYRFPPRTFLETMAGDSAWGVVPSAYDESRLAKFVLPPR